MRENRGEAVSRREEWSHVFEKGSKEFAKFRQVHAKWLFQHPSATQFNKVSRPDEQFGKRLDKETVEKVLHHQAVNIPHLSDDQEELRRLEFRFFKGQTNPEEIYNSIKLIAEIVDTAQLGGDRGSRQR